MEHPQPGAPAVSCSHCYLSMNCTTVRSLRRGSASVPALALGMHSHSQPQTTTGLSPAHSFRDLPSLDAGVLKPRCSFVQAGAVRNQRCVEKASSFSQLCGITPPVLITLERALVIKEVLQLTYLFYNL